MTQRSSRVRQALFAGLAASALGLGALHLRYPLPYVYRVLAYRESDFDDVHRFRARSISPSESPSVLTVALDSGVEALLESHRGVEDLDRFLNNTRTTAFLAVHDGVLVLERYLRGHDRDSVQNTFSISKSITSALVGLAERDGALELAAPITRYLPELAERDARFGEITVQDLLDMRSGIGYSGDVTFPFVNADDPLIYYHPDLESVALGRTSIESAPGSFHYNNYNPVLLGLILRRTTGVSVSEYLERELWAAMGARYPAGWLVDDQGVERMESGFFARAEDLARFGRLVLDRGSVAGRAVIPEAWVLESTAAASSWEAEAYDGRGWEYRLGWWVLPRAEGPPDVAAIGAYGQYVYVSPQHQTVFVRTGPGRGDWGDRDWTELFYSTAEQLSRRPPSLNPARR